MKNVKYFAIRFFLGVAIAVMLIIALSVFTGCAITKPEARMNRLLRNHPELIGKMFKNDTVFTRHDSTVYLPGASDTVLLPGLETIRPGQPPVIILNDTSAGLMASMWRDYANHLHLALSKRPDSLQIQWKDRAVNHYHTQIQTELPEWAKVVLGVMAALIVIAIVVLFIIFKRH